MQKSNKKHNLLSWNFLKQFSSLENSKKSGTDHTKNTYNVLRFLRIHFCVNFLLDICKTIFIITYRISEICLQEM